jgi:amino acid adenylation domain-containing protein
LAQFDLNLEIQDQGEQLAGALNFNRDIFEHETIERMAGHYRTILEGFVADSKAHLSDLPLLTQNELSRLSAGWTEPTPHIAENENIQTWFESQVERTPQAVAVEFEGEMLTYADLNMRANRLAYSLIDLGVGPDQLVGLCVEPSLYLVVGILGILKAGGAYVPLDPQYPSERLQFMLGDAEIELVVSEERSLSQINHPGLRIHILDVESGRKNSIRDENPKVDVGQRNLAYVLYTSGSTGEPKGVLVTHGNVLQLLGTAGEHCNFGRKDVWALFHSFTFDFSVWEFFGALLFGGRLIVISPQMRHALDNYFEQVVFKRLTVMSMIPPLFFEASRMPKFYQRLRSSNLRHIFFGGDLLDESALQPFFWGSQANAIRATNIYGPTETTVFVTWHDLSGEELDESLGSTIGRPLAGTRIFILDPHQNPLPAGVPGEIVIAGSSVTRGYLNRPELNRERFIQHPLDPRPNARLYRTGDIGRLSADGVLEFLSRQDSQVKIRGFRVELGEVETALRSHPAVADAVVNLVDAGNQDAFLAAYVIFEQDKSLQLSELRDFLSKTLPEYMIPTALKEIEAIPLTPIGKLDRSMLPDLGPKERGLETVVVKPETELEKRLMVIWTKVLGISDVGVRDSFFNLGGHSLMAMQLVARVREELSVELNVQDIFGRGQTIAGMAELIELRSWLTSETRDKGNAAEQDQEQGRI